MMGDAMMYGLLTMVLGTIIASIAGLPFVLCFGLSGVLLFGGMGITVLYKSKKKVIV